MSEEQTLTDFLNFLDVDPESRPLVSAILANPGRFYRKFSIPKRRDGHRLISSPYPSLANIQQKILEKILSALTMHECAFAYKKKSNAIQHAALHAGQKELLTLDIKDFFGSISRQMVFQVFVDAGVSPRFCSFASILCCLGNALPQGACTSPVLSNLIFARLDERLNRLAKKLNLVYSRYADDLAFSGPYIPRSLVKTVERILESKRFVLNSEKTQFKIAGAKKILTGVSISTGVVKAPKTFKRELRAQIHVLETSVNNLATLPALDPFVFERVLGKLNYLLQVEPDNQYAAAKKQLLSIYHQNFLSKIDWDAIILPTD